MTPWSPRSRTYLGPPFDDARPRVLESANGNSILAAHEAELESLGAFFHDRFHRCGGFATYTAIERRGSAITASPNDVVEAGRRAHAACRRGNGNQPDAAGHRQDAE